MLQLQLVRYCLVGLVNTAITFITIVVATHIGLDKVVANATGFAAGLINSYLMNKTFTFRQSQTGGRRANFIVSFLFAFGINLIILFATGDLQHIHPLAPQLCAVFSYNVAFFIMMKLWVFRQDPGDS
jgi:putative flippase GtrA